MALFGNLVSALAGRTLGRTVGGSAGGPAGAALGLALPFVARRMGPLGMAGMAVGAWAINRAMQQRAASPTLPMARGPKVTAPPVPMVLGD